MLTLLAHKVFRVAGGFFFLELIDDNNAEQFNIKGRVHARHTLWGSFREEEEEAVISLRLG